MTGQRTGVYPGTFDPVTNGHLDIVSRAARVVDKLIIAVAVKAGKDPLFSFDERVEMLEHEVSNLTEGVAGRIEVATDAQGRREIALLDDSGNVVSAIMLAIGQSASLRDAAGRNVRVHIDAGMLTIQALASSRVQVYPDGSTSVVTTPVGYLLILLTVFLAVLGLATLILFLLVCRALAIRSNNRRLAGRFKDILWLIVTAPAIGVVVSVGAIFDIQSEVGANALIVPALSALFCLLFAVVAQIVVSLQLSSALLKAPRHWSEVAAVPGGE